VLAVRNQLKRLLHSYPKLFLGSRHFVITLAPLRLSFSRYCIRYFPAISFVIFPALRSLLFLHITFVIFPPLHSHFPSLPFVIFPPLCSSFSRHFVCHFPAVAFVTFSPLRLSFSRHCARQSLSRCSRHYICHHVRSFCHLVTFYTFVIFLRYVLHFSPEGLS